MEGLSNATAREKLASFGPNTIVHQKKVSALSMLLAQFKGGMFWLLVGAIVISAALGEYIDAIAISIILILNGVIGFFQEYRAERALEALKAMTAPRARVMREGRTITVPAADVVPGDLLVLEAGDIVAADATISSASSLAINEAVLTGESIPVEKTAGDHAEASQLFLGTTVVRGTGVAEVIATGMGTEFGKIAHLLSGTEDEQTPLQKRISDVSQHLLFLCVGIVLIVALLGFLRGTPPLDIFLGAVSLAVAAVPEGLLAVVTIALAIGVQRMAKRKALVRKLSAVETLGCATVICTDKTATLTEGKMIVREVWGPDQNRLLFAAAACTDAELHSEGDAGDPTEVALLVEARKLGIERGAIESSASRRFSNPFDSDRKMMSIFRSDGVLYVKGAVESILANSKTAPSGMHDAATEMAGRGLRVIAVALGDSTSEQNLDALGLIGISDPPRPEVAAAVRSAQAAGIRVIMITGDHPVTAAAIAKEVGILKPDQEPEGRVYARSSPASKLEIVRRLKSENHIVAMTGDGVNDAPALQEAHIGIAMGISGTEVSREVSEIVLADDNFATIIAAVGEGRGVYENIRKSLTFLLSGNMSELLIMLTAAVVGLPTPFLALHLLWINLVTDGLPALALAADPASPSLMKHKPRPLKESILGRPQWIWIGFTALVETATVLAVYHYTLRTEPLDDARNAAFTVLVFAEVWRAFSARSPDRLFWEEGIFSNLKLIAVVVFIVALQVAIHHIPLTEELFKIGNMGLLECGVYLAIGLIPVTVLELSKLIMRFRK
ncbi:MAG: cation-translocating P-type ATPase [Leptospirales bacterium]|nr:cation-translocating P-type ATPase [Leptospirales bacterium]